MEPGDSISAWIVSLKGADAEAARRLWERYANRLTDVARQQLSRAPRGFADEDDIAQSVFGAVCRGAAAGRFGDIKNRDELWWLLLAITKRKIVSHVRHESAQRRGMGRVFSETLIGATTHKSVDFSLDRLMGDEPTPEFVAELKDQLALLLASLPNDGLRRVAVSRIEGYTAEEIAAQLSISSRSVERKLRLIRTTLAQQLAAVE